MLPIPSGGISSGVARPERRAVLILIVVGAAGVLVRLLAGSSGAPGAVAYHAAQAPRPPLDSVAARAGRLARPLRRGETVDLDRASAEEITRLPRIGPGLAARIVADRDAHGPFGSLDGLDRVSGIGPSVLEAVKPYAVFLGRSDYSVATDRSTVRPLDRPSQRRGGAQPGSIEDCAVSLLRCPPIGEREHRDGRRVGSPSGRRADSAARGRGRS